MSDLEEFQTAMQEEFWEFTAAEFLVAGSFWVLVQRFILDIATSSSLIKDRLIEFCIVCFFGGLWLGYVGLRQLRRRKNKIERIIANAEENAARLAESQTVTAGGKLK